MSREEQIKNMARAIHLNCHKGLTSTEAEMIAKWCYQEIDRVSLKNAMEIFEELLKDITHGLEIARCTRKKFLHNIEKNNIWVYHYDGEIEALEGMECLIAELKKKYTESEKDNG